MNRITLVRIDGDTKHEVDIPVGETIIGRGPVMQCTDKRVSRTHALIKVSEDGKIELTATSLNPCYYNRDKVIRKSSSVELKIGDRFSFLQDSYCYCVKAHSVSDGAACSSDIVNDGVGTGEDQIKLVENGVLSVNPDAVCTIAITPVADEPHGEKSEVSADVGSTANSSGEMTDPDVPNNSAKDGPADISLLRKYVPKWLLAATERAKRRGEESAAEESGTEKVKTAHSADAAEENRSVREIDGSAEKGSGGAVEGAGPASAAHQMSDDSESEEPAGAGSSEEVVRRRPSPPRPSPPRSVKSGSTEEKTRSGEGENTAADTARDPSPVPTSSRESCKYGSDCYRKNPQHRADFSHPEDPDYKDDERPECSYGTDCYRKNPLHRQTYKHTKKPPNKKRRVKKGAPKDAGDSSDEDDYDYDDPFLNDASSDDYEPTDSGSDVSSASEGEEEEDQKRRKNEAKRFVRGKRKRRN